MTLTLPTPDASDTARQRFALELLLQQPVPGPEQLLASRILLSDALPDVSPDQWRALQAMPIAIGAEHLDIAIPSQWRDQEWQHLIDQLPDQHRTIRLHPAIDADLLQALATETDEPATEPTLPPEEESNSPAAAKPDTTLDVSAESFLQDFSPDGVLESDEDDDTQLARDAIDLETSLKDAEASPVVTLVDRILLQAMSVNASDIHVEPQQKGLRLRSPVALYAAGAILISIWLLGRFYATHNGRRTIDRLVLKLPLFGELILMTATAQFCRIFSSLTRAGVPILMSMEISSETADNAIISDAILASRGMVQEGVLLSNALIRQKVLPDMALNMLAIGEETGEMDKMLSKVADFYEDEVGAMVKALTSMLEPAMIVVVGGIVGSILLAMYLPMFTVFDQIQ